jgi:hypothetical protein
MKATKRRSRALLLRAFRPRVLSGLAHIRGPFSRYPSQATSTLLLQPMNVFGDGAMRPLVNTKLHDLSR